MALHTQATEQWKQVVIPAQRETGATAAQLKAGKEAEAPGKNTNMESGGLWGDDGFTFGDLIDLINPLQHIPFVATAYRAITGDEISPAARMAGGAVLGGIVGLVASGINAAIEAGTGKDVGEHALAMFSGISLDNVASEAADPPAAALLSSADPVTRLAEKEEDEEEPAEEQSTEEPASRQKLFALNPPETQQNDGRAAYIFGSLEQATQRYQQAQSADRLLSVAQSMDITS